MVQNSHTDITVTTVERACTIDSLFYYFIRLLYVDHNILNKHKTLQKLWRRLMNWRVLN